MTPLSVAEVRLTLDACTAVTAGAESTERECRAELEQRTSIRDLAKVALRSAEHRFDVEETEAAALAVASARRDLEGAELLVGKSRERRERAEASLRIALEARERADRELRVLELRAKLEAPPEPLDRLDARRLDVARARIEAERIVKQANDEAERIVKQANDPFALEVDALLARLDDGEKARAELEDLGEPAPPTSPIHIFAPWLRSQLDAGELRLIAQPTWTVRGGVVDGDGELSAAWRALGGLREALRLRDVGAVLVALDRLAAPSPECQPVAGELVELLEQHHDDASILAAIAEREQPERAAIQREVQREAEESAERARAAEAKSRAEYERRFAQKQAVLGNAYARRRLGIDGLTIIEGQPLPTESAIARAARAAAKALGLIDPDSATPTRGGFAASLPSAVPPAVGDE